MSFFERLESINLQIFHWLNAGPSPSAPLKIFATLSAEALIYVLAITLVFAWIRGNERIRLSVVYAIMAALFALGINQLIGLFWYHPRPFELGVGHTLLSHKPETSFPSDHAVVFWATAFAFARWPETRRWGCIVGLVGVLVAWSRVWLGIHFPLDMLGSFLVALVSVGVLYPMSAWIDKRLLPGLIHTYDLLVRRLGLPADWFPHGHQGEGE